MRCALLTIKGSWYIYQNIFFKVATITILFIMSVGPRGSKDKVTLSRASLHPYQELRQLNDYLFNFF